ncbi:TolC family protein [Sphingomonas sp. DT-207]|uniref:TolC family protein n=1 Tax=Sphingomonas sp. DT-207 TaxID=3396167 RepID=UPI003F1A201C
MGALLCGFALLASLNARAQTASPSAPIPPPSGVRPSMIGKPVPLSLIDAVALGLRDNRTIRAAFLERVAQRFRLHAAEQRFAPRLDIVADLYREDIAGAVIGSASVGGTGSLLLPSGAQIGFVWDRRERLDGRGNADAASLAITQPLLRGGGFAVNRAPVRIAQLQDSIDRLSLRNTLSEGISRIVFAYRALQQAQAQVRLAELALARTAELIATNRELIDAGRMAAADIVQSEADQANQQVALYQTRQQRNSAQLALLELLSVDPGTNIVASDPIAAEQVPVDLERAIAIARASRMDLLAQQRVVQQAREGLRIARNQRLWDLSLVAAATRVGGRDPALGPLPAQTDNRIGVQLAIPLGDPAPQLAVVEADTGLRTAELQLEAIDQAVETQVRDAAQRVEAAWLQVEAARRFKALAARAVDVEREKLAAGRSSNFQVLSLQDGLRAAEVQEVAAVVAYLDSLTSFDLQIGATLDSWNIEWSDQ